MEAAAAGTEEVVAADTEEVAAVAADMEEVVAVAADTEAVEEGVLDLIILTMPSTIIILEPILGSVNPVTAKMLKENTGKRFINFK